MKVHQYKYDEDNTLKYLKEYIDETYGQHYSQNKFQATEFIMDSGHGEGFCIGNIMKYAQRYGKKNGHNKADLLKVLHYAIMMIHVHNQREKTEKNKLHMSPNEVSALPMSTSMATTALIDGQMSFHFEPTHKPMEVISTTCLPMYQRF